MYEREIHFYRCRGGTVAFESVISDGDLRRLDEERVCPLCGAPVADHDSFTLRARTETSSQAVRLPDAAPRQKIEDGRLSRPSSPLLQTRSGGATRRTWHRPRRRS